MNVIVLRYERAVSQTTDLREDRVPCRSRTCAAVRYPCLRIRRCPRAISGRRGPFNAIDDIPVRSAAGRLCVKREGAPRPMNELDALLAADIAPVPTDVGSCSAYVGHHMYRIGSSDGSARVRIPVQNDLGATFVGDSDRLRAGTANLRTEPGILTIIRRRHGARTNGRKGPAARNLIHGVVSAHNYRTVGLSVDRVMTGSIRILVKRCSDKIYFAITVRIRTIRICYIPGGCTCTIGKIRVRKTTGTVQRHRACTIGVIIGRACRGDSRKIHQLKISQPAANKAVCKRRCDHAGRYITHRECKHR